MREKASITSFVNFQGPELTCISNNETTIKKAVTCSTENFITEFVVYGLMRFDVKWKPTNLLANGKDQDELKKSQISNEAFGGYWLLLLYKGVYVAAESEPRVARSLMSTGSLKQTWWKFQDKAMFNYICYHLSTRLSGLNTLRSIFSHFAADTEFAHRSLANLGTIHHL